MSGDIIETVEDLEALPDRSVILDRHGDAWQQTGTLQEGDTTQAAWLGSVPVSCRQSSAVDLPARVLHVPGEQPYLTREDATQRLARAAFLVDGTHHFHMPEGSDRPVCSCGFVGNARKRTQTEHITTAVLEAFDHD